MGQKVNPLGFRLGYSQKYHADWFAFPQNYSKTLYQDLQIRKYLNKEFPDTESGIANILIKRTTHKFYLQIHTARPRLFLDSEDSVKKKEEIQENIEKEKEKTKKEKEIEEEIEKILELYDIENPIELDKIFSKQKILNSKECPKGLVNLRRYIEKLLLNQILLKLSLLEERKPDSNVSLLAASLAYQLEKRVAFRRAVKQTIKRAQAEPKVLGIKVQVSGRLNGAEIARSEWVREGRVPLHTLRAEVGYATHKAKTLYGILGIKIWLYKEAKNVYFRKIIVKSKDDILINLNKYTPEEKQKINKKPHFEEKKFTIPVLLAKPKRNQ